MKRKKEKGFSLLELLATIFIIGIVLSITGYSVFSIINNSKEKSYTLAMNNVKQAANTIV